MADSSLGRRTHVLGTHKGSWRSHRIEETQRECNKRIKGCSLKIAKRKGYTVTNAKGGSHAVNEAGKTIRGFERVMKCQA